MPSSLNNSAADETTQYNTQETKTTSAPKRGSIADRFFTKAKTSEIENNDKEDPKISKPKLGKKGSVADKFFTKVETPEMKQQEEKELLTPKLGKKGSVADKFFTKVETETPSSEGKRGSIANSMFNKVPTEKSKEEISVKKEVEEEQYDVENQKRIENVSFEFCNDNEGFEAMGDPIHPDDDISEEEETLLPGTKYGEDTTCLEYVFVNNLERIIKKLTKKKTRGITGTDDVVQEGGEEEEKYEAPKVIKSKRRQKSMTNLTESAIRFHTEDEDDERELDEAELRDKPKFLTQREKRDKVDRRIARKLAVVGLRFAGRGRELKQREVSDSDSEDSVDNLLDHLEDGKLHLENNTNTTQPKPLLKKSSDLKERLKAKKESLKESFEEEKKNRKTSNKTHRHHKESSLSTYLQKTIDKQLNIGGRPVDDSRPIDDRFAYIALENKLKKVFATNEPIEDGSAVQRLISMENEHDDEKFSTEEQSMLDAAVKYYKLCDEEGDGKVQKQALYSHVHSDPEVTEALGLPYDFYENLNGELDDKFELFWLSYYHGYKATEDQEGGLSKNDFIDMVTRNRLSRAAAFVLFNFIDIHKHGFISQDDIKTAVVLHPPILDMLMLETEEEDSKLYNTGRRRRVHQSSSFYDDRLPRWWDEADPGNSGLIDLNEFTKAYQCRSLVAYRWKPDSLKFKISFKKNDPTPETEEEWVRVNGYKGFDYVFVSPWPENDTHGKFMESLMLSLKAGGLDTFVYRTSSHGVSINRDARLVIKVRMPMQRMEAYASSSGYRLLLSKDRLIAEAKHSSQLDKDFDHTQPFLFIAHDKDRMKLHPYDFIYCPYHKGDWWKRYNGKKNFFHCPGGLKHPFTSKHRVRLLADLFSDPVKLGGCGLKLHTMEENMVDHFPLHRPHMLSHISSQFTPTFVQRLHDFRDMHNLDLDRKSNSDAVCCTLFRAIPLWCCAFGYFQIAYLWYVPVQLLRDYFGEKTALYFAFIGEYVRWQMMLSFIGFLVTMAVYMEKVNETTVAPWVAIGVSFWAELFCRHWKSFEYAFGCRFGVLKHEGFINMRDRPNFKGVLARSVIDGSEILHYPWERRLARYILSTMVIFLLAMLGFFLVGAILGLRIYLVRSEKTHTWAEQVSSSVLGIYITVSNEIFRSVALKLTLWENHRTDADFENALIFKLFVVQFINSYATLFYVAFVKGPLEGCDNDHCSLDLSRRLLYLLIARVGYKFIEKAVFPRCAVILRKCRALMTAKHLEHELDYVADHQMHLNNYDQIMETTISYDELVVDLGYMVLFAAAVPITPLLMLPLTLIRKYYDGSRLIFDFRRPLPISTTTIGAWNGVLHILARIAMMTNAAVVLFTLNGMSLLQRNERNMFYAELSGFCLTFLLVVFRPATESFAIKVQRLRQQHIVNTLHSMYHFRNDDDSFDGHQGQYRDDSEGDEDEEGPRMMRHADSFQGPAVGFHHYAV